MKYSNTYLLNILKLAASKVFYSKFKPSQQKALRPQPFKAIKIISFYNARAYYSYVIAVDTRLRWNGIWNKSKWTNDTDASRRAQGINCQLFRNDAALGGSYEYDINNAGHSR